MVNVEKNTKKSNVVVFDESKVDMVALEKEFNGFVEGVKAETKKASVLIQVKELDEIQEDIMKAKDYIESFSNGDNRTKPQKFYSMFKALPVLGAMAEKKEAQAKQKHFEESNVEEIVSEMFSAVNNKKDKLKKIGHSINGMRNSLIDQEGKLATYIGKLDVILDNTTNPVTKMSALDMSTIAQTQHNITKELVYNQMDFILELMGNMMVKINKTLPALESTLQTSLAVTGTIHNMKDTINIMNSLESLSNDIIKKSTGHVQELIVEATDALTSGIDIEFLEQSGERNAQFSQSLIESRHNYIIKQKETYVKLKNIQINTDNMLSDRRQSEMLALEGINDELVEARNKVKKTEADNTDVKVEAVDFDKHMGLNPDIDIDDIEITID